MGNLCTHPNGVEGGYQLAQIATSIRFPTAAYTGMVGTSPPTPLPSCPAPSSTSPPSAELVCWPPHAACAAGLLLAALAVQLLRPGQLLGDGRAPPLRTALPAGPGMSPASQPSHESDPCASSHLPIPRAASNLCVIVGTPPSLKAPPSPHITQFRAPHAPPCYSLPLSACSGPAGAGAFWLVSVGERPAAAPLQGQPARLRGHQRRDHARYHPPTARHTSWGGSSSLAPTSPCLRTDCSCFFLLPQARTCSGC